MNLSFKRILCALMCLCLCMSFAVFSPAAASADSAIEKVLCTISQEPVAHYDSRQVYANTSTAGCYIEEYYWQEVSTGYYVSLLFGTGNVRVHITLRAMDGWYFSDNVSAYLNNSSVYATVGEGGKTLSFTREYSPALWQPSVIKNPGSERTDEGGMVSFVASATLTESYEWFLVDPESGKEHSVYDVGSLFEGVSTSSLREGQMNLHNVPAAMDGWQIYCKFIGPGGSSKSAKASIKVNYETPPPTETPAPTPEVTEAPEETAAPEPEAEAALDSSELSHAHSYSAAWRHDDMTHWRECQCGARVEQVQHTMVWTQTEKATKSHPGISRGECSVCGYAQEKEIAYDGADSILKYIILGLGGLVVLTILVLVVDSILASRRRKRRRRNRRR